MVGNKGKGSRSKLKALEHGPAEPEPFQICLDDSAEASEGEDGKNDISNGTEILFEEKIIYGSVVSDGLEENNQNAFEDNGLENDAATEIKVDRTEDVCTLEGTIDDVKEMSDGGHTTTNLGEDIEERIHTDNPEEDEALLKFDCNNLNIGVEKVVPTEDVSANNEASASDHGLRKDVTDNLENPKEPSKVDANEPVGTPSDRVQEENIEENANITNEVKVVSGKVNRPKGKVIRKKLVKKKLVGRNAASQPSNENYAFGEAFEVDVDENIDNKDKASDVNNASDEAFKGDNNEHVSNEEAAEVKPSVKVNKKRIRNRKKKAPQGHSGIATIKDTQKPQSQNDKSGSEKQIAIKEPDVKNDEVEKSEPLKRSKNKKIAKKESKELVSKDVKKPKEGKSSKKVDCMGMIFMCSSETKKDCFRYKVLGLPASKKDMVLKIYKGMRLFLFDVDLRMMYGIYKAAGPGGYNIEPRAFKSKFPSQVRFAVLQDSVPLAEEIFKKVLEDNYYSKKKFNFQLNQEQVKNLCKLFHEASRKASSTKAASKPQRAAATSSTSRRDNKRKRVDDSRRVAVARPPPVERERIRRKPHEEIRHAPVVIANRYQQRPTYERETYVPSVAMAPVPIYQPLPPPCSPPRSTTYSYDRVLGVDPYRRETVIDSRDLAPSRESRLPIIERSHYDSRGLAPSRESRLPIERSHYDSRDLAPSRESRLPIERSHYDSYMSYREAPQVYSAQAYSSAPRREHYDYSASADGQYGGAEYYRTADYRPPLPLYRRY